MLTPVKSGWASSLSSLRALHGAYAHQTNIQRTMYAAAAC